MEQHHFPTYYLVLGSLSSLFLFMLFMVKPICMLIGYFFKQKLDKVYGIYKLLINLRLVLLLIIMLGWLFYGQ